MFTTVNEEVAALEKLWSEEKDINVLRARLTIRLEGLKARYRQGRPGFTGTNIQKIEALFEGLKLVDSLEQKLQGADMQDSSKQHRRIKDGLRLAKLLGDTALAQRVTSAFRKELSELKVKNERQVGWHPQMAPLYSSSLSMASVTC